MKKNLFSELKIGLSLFDHSAC